MKLFTNWKTTSVGLTMIIGAIVAFVLHKGEWTQEVIMIQVAAIMGGIGFLVTKDFNVTGGTKDQGTPPSIIESPKVVEETKKVASVLIALLMLNLAIGQQIKKPFFGKVKDVEVEALPNQRGAVFTAKVTPTDSTFMNLRPVTGVAYSFPNNQAQGYAGISYGNTTYNYKTKESYINWSFDIVYSLGATTTTKEVESQGSSFGFGGFVLNRNVGVLLLWNKYKKVDPAEPDKPLTWKPTVAVTYGINF